MQDKISNENPLEFLPDDSASHRASSLTRENPALVQWVLHTGVVTTKEQAHYALLAVVGIIAMVSIAIFILGGKARQKEADPVSQEYIIQHLRDFPIRDRTTRSPSAANP